MTESSATTSLAEMYLGDAGRAILTVLRPAAGPIRLGALYVRVLPQLHASCGSAKDPREFGLLMKWLARRGYTTSVVMRGYAITDMGRHLLADIEARLDDGELRWGCPFCVGVDFSVDPDELAAACAAGDVRNGGFDHRDVQILRSDWVGEWLGRRAAARVPAVRP
jgi:hypothetical protein